MSRAFNRETGVYTYEGEFEIQAGFINITRVYTVEYDSRTCSFSMTTPIDFSF